MATRRNRKKGAVPPVPSSGPGSASKPGTDELDLKAIGRRLAEARGLMTVVEFADLVGVHENTQGRYERGERAPSSSYLNAASARADINPLWVLHGDGERSFSQAAGGEPDAAWSERGITIVIQAKPSQLRQSVARYGNLDAGPTIKGRVPLLSLIQAGSYAEVVDNFHPGHADEWVETTVPIHKHTYALRVDGDSMTSPNGEDPTFPQGTVIVVEPDAITDLDNLVGRFVIFKRDGQDAATFKKLVRDAGAYYLKPLNPAYPLIRVGEGDVCCGVIREKLMRFF